MCVDVYCDCYLPTPLLRRLRYSRAVPRTRIPGADIVWDVAVESGAGVPLSAAADRGAADLLPHPRQAHDRRCS
eukprot:3642304-Rhodomonas_salina.3